MSFELSSENYGGKCGTVVVSFMLRCEKACCHVIFSLPLGSDTLDMYLLCCALFYYTPIRF